jgi:hypothetical protein
MALRLIYQMFTTLLGWIVLRTRSDTTKEIEILVLRQLSVLQLRTPRPRMTWTDRVWVPRTVTRPDQGVQDQRTDLAVTVHNPRSMISRCGHPTRVPANRARASLRVTARNVPTTRSDDMRMTDTSPLAPRTPTTSTSR